MKPVLACEPGFHCPAYLQTQTYTEPVPLKHGKLATQYICGYTDIFLAV